MEHHVEKDIIGKSKKKISSSIGAIPSPSEALKKLQDQVSSTQSGSASPLMSEIEYASCCVLSYERPNFLHNSLKSLKDQPGFPYELIIHDDGSKHPIIGPDVLAPAWRDGATVILNAPGWNQGQGIALNRMFHMAKGDIIIKLDADLQYYPGWLLETVRLMRENPTIGLLGLLHYYHDPVDSHKTVIDRHDEWSSHTHILGSAFALRRETWEELGPFEEHSDAFAEDYDMQCRVTASENWVCALPKESLVKNLGMGLGTSVVVVADENGEPTVAKFHKEPFIIGKENEQI